MWDEMLNAESNFSRDVEFTSLFLSHYSNQVGIFCGWQKNAN